MLGVLGVVLFAAIGTFLAFALLTDAGVVDVDLGVVGVVVGVLLNENEDVGVVMVGVVGGVVVGSLARVIISHYYTRQD